MPKTTNPESGLRNYRIEFAREASYGVTPTDPSFLKYSDAVASVSWSPDATNEPRRSIGDVDPKSFIRGFETHEITVEYDLVKWFDDGSGSAEDAAYDGIQRASDGSMPNSHSFVAREDRSANIQAEATVENLEGSAAGTARPTRTYTVGRGGFVDEATVTGDPSSAQPVTVELSYVFKKVRTHKIDQPNSSTLLCFSSTDAGDTSQSLTIEDEGAATAETLTLNGTTLVSSSKTYSDIDALNLSAETVGDVEVFVNDGTNTTPTAGELLSVIRGSGSYSGIEGDLGVPALGAGSHESLSETVETFVGDSIHRATDPAPHEIQSMSINVANNVETQGNVEEFGQDGYAGNREVTAEATMYGEATTHDLLKDHLTNVGEDFDWTMDGGTLRVVGATLTDPGERAAEEGQAVMTIDNTFMGTDLSLV